MHAGTECVEHRALCMYRVCMYVCSARQEPEASYLHIYKYTQGLAGYVATYLDFFFFKKKKEKKRK